MADFTTSSAAQQPPPSAEPGPDRASSRLPIPLTSFVGREESIEAISGMLRDGARLVTLTGPGGVGKTRLALEVARRFAADRAGDVAFVDLSPLSDPALIFPAIAQQLGIRETPDQMPAQRLAAVLRDRRLLLVLDNFEHLIDGAPLVIDLLAASPRLTTLVTSRARLHLSAERVYPVSPLPLPSSDADAGELAEIDAVRLFVARAQQVNPAFSLTETNAATIAEICRRLDGLPLAIELAAARANLMPPLTLLSRLERRLPLLTRGARDQPPRLQTMRHAIAWSHELLNEEERTLFRRLSVFAGGCTFEAAEAVAGESTMDVLQALTSLADKSLLRQLPDDGGPARLGMLETVREFGLEQLAASGEEADVRERHATWYGQLAEQAREELLRANQREWVELLDREHANVRAALTWLLDRGYGERALRLSGGMFLFWFLRGHLREGASWLSRSLEGAPAADPADRAWALFATGLLSWAQGDFDRAEALARQGLELAESHGLTFGKAVSLYLLHNIRFVQGRFDEAVAVGEELIPVMRAAGNLPWLAFALCDYGSAVAATGERARGRALIDEGLALHRELGNKQGAGNHLSDMGFDALADGDLPLATATFTESVRLHWEGGDRWYLASPIAGLAAIAARTGHAALAARLIGASSSIRERSGAPLWPAEQEHLERAIGDARAALGDDFERQAEAGRELRLDEAVAESLAAVSALIHEPPASGQPILLPGGLSPRELEVLRLVADGRSNQEIADALFVSVGTVRTHVSNILGKLDARSRTEAAAIARREGWL